ncbi:MAG: HlyD family efflux transporter periplasmic adaptor subunit [Deltaproteobacteria bacterium]|nr:HlyD family efflux transporter periplasmic adaptor subunit [Deltaproteobacteria bacterium]
MLLLLELARSARAARSAEELAFLAVNETHVLHAYRQAVFWLDDGGIKALSGVVQPDTNVPYAQWLDRVCRYLQNVQTGPRVVTAGDIPDELAAEWSEWLPAFGLWVPLGSGQEAGGVGLGGILFAAEQPWPDAHIDLLSEWIDIWRHAWLAHSRPDALTFGRMKKAVRGWFQGEVNIPWWKQRRVRAVGLLLAVLLFPVRLSVLAPGELVPANPAVIRAPLDGVIGQFHVKPNDIVKAGQPLFGFDEASIVTRLEVANQALATAQTEYRQFAQQAVSDTRSKAQLATLLGKIEEKRAEADYLHDQLDRSRVVAPQDGVAIFDDPMEWIGRPVQTGERIMRISAPGDVEVEAWLPIGDAIPLSADASVTLYLAASPLNSLSGQVRYVAYDATMRPEGVFAYRLRAKLDESTHQRVGLKGTVRVNGRWVPLSYWVIRRPLGTFRQILGI